MFSLLGRMAYRWRWAILIIWSAVLLLALPLLPRAGEALKGGGFSPPTTEHARALEVLHRKLQFSESTLLVIYQSDHLPVTDLTVQAAITRSLARVRTLPGVIGVLLPSLDRNLISDDGDTAYAIVSLGLRLTEAERLLPAFENALQPQDGLRMEITGAPAFIRDIETVSQHDLRRAEAIVFPIALVTLLLVFGSPFAAAIPLVVGAAGVAMVLVSLFFVAHTTDLSIFVLNLATMLGLGLAIDYSLFVASRFREELIRQRGNVSRAVEHATATAGKAIFFSGLTVLIGLMGLSVFELMFLRSVGIAGVIVVAWSTVAALTLLPALLSVLGPWINRFPVWRSAASASDVQGFWARLSRQVMARPLFVLIPTLALLLLLGMPFLRANISSSDATVIPRDQPSRQAFDLLVSEFGAGAISPFLIVLESSSDVFTDERLGAIYDAGARLARDPRVTRVQSVVPPTLSKQQAITLARLQRRLNEFGVDTGTNRLGSDDAAVILVYTNYLPNDEASKALLTDLRATPIPGFHVMVGGNTAETVDVVNEVYTDFPRAVALVVVATYVVLLVLFRSLILPLKAILMNALSILASYGALVWVFQEGNLSQYLGFTRLGFVEASLPVVMFCVLFGLSMDYEIFLLSRMREEWERTGNNTQAVAIGLQRSGRIVTAAALLVVVVTGAFVSADLVLIKSLGFGIALAVLLDATIVRALLMPATMRLLGDWNWWLPSPLQRLLPLRPSAEEKL
jgi:RND superfamily putative drug exporter